MPKGHKRKLAFLTLAVASVVAAQSPAPKKDVPTIAKSAKGAVVTIVMANNDTPISSGAGFLVSADGVIVTNYHVIEYGNIAIAKFSDGTTFPVDGVLAADKVRDLAIIKIHGKSFPALTLGNSDRLQIGEDVVAIGNPLVFLELTVSNGILSGLLTIEKEGGKFLQVTAPISHGSSGGPLFNMAGEVIGITSGYFEGGENLNLAIPVNDAKRLLLNQSAKLQNLPNEKVEDQTAHRDSHSTELRETLQWLRNASETESYASNKDHKIIFESSADDSCAVSITETNHTWAMPIDRPDEASDLKMSFSLADIDPEAITNTTFRNPPNLIPFSHITFHTTNYTKKIRYETRQALVDTHFNDGELVTNDLFGPKFARALRRAVELCGGKPSSF